MVAKFLDASPAGCETISFEGLARCRDQSTNAEKAQRRSQTMHALLLEWTGPLTHVAAHGRQTPSSILLTESIPTLNIAVARKDHHLTAENASYISAGEEAV